MWLPFNLQRKIRAGNAWSKTKKEGAGQKTPRTYEKNSVKEWGKKNKNDKTKITKYFGWIAFDSRIRVKGRESRYFWNWEEELDLVECVGKFVGSGWGVLAKQCCRGIRNGTYSRETKRTNLSSSLRTRKISSPLNRKMLLQDQAQLFGHP